MSEIVLQTVQQLVQDVIAPDVRELKVRMATVEKQIEQFEKHMDMRFESFERKTDAQFKSQGEKTDA